MIHLGRRYQDKITGFSGIATGSVTYLSGCNQALLAPQVAADGAIREPLWFDVQRLTQVGTDVIVLDNGPTPGCDTAAPRR